MLNWIPPEGLFKGDKIEKYLDKAFHHQGFDNLKVPLFIVSADINTGETVIFCPKKNVPRGKIPHTSFITDAKVSTAVRASISLPGIFLPKRVKHNKLVDGGIKNNIPVDILYYQGIRKVIAVDLSVSDNKPKVDSLVDILMASMSIMGEELSHQRRNMYPAYYIFPNVQGVGYQDFNQIRKIVEYGEEVGRRELRDIKKYVR